MCYNYCACALEPGNHNSWATCRQLLSPAALGSVLPTRSHCKEKPRTATREKPVHQWRASAAKHNQLIKKKKSPPQIFLIKVGEGEKKQDRQKVDSCWTGRQIYESSLYSTCVYIERFLQWKGFKTRNSSISHSILRYSSLPAKQAKPVVKGGRAEAEEGEVRSPRPPFPASAPPSTEQRGWPELFPPWSVVFWVDVRLSRTTAGRRRAP